MSLADRRLNSDHEHHDPRHGATSSGPRRRFVLGVTLLVLSAACWLAPPAPVERAVGHAPMKMHVAEIVPTDAAFHEATRAFHGTAAFWRVSIRDADNEPVAGARVRVDVVAPDGAVVGRPTMTTGADGLALFNRPLTESDVQGVYIVRVISVSHLNRDGAVYDHAANAAWANSFSVTRSSRRH
jgi:hypothetical protein